MKDAHAPESTASVSSDEKKLLLNKGNKWLADSSTKANVHEMTLIVSQYNGSKNTFQDLKAAGQSIQKASEKLIKECRMKGKDHDALHSWLEPLLIEIKMLNTATDEASASEHFNKIYAQVNLFQESFN